MGGIMILAGLTIAVLALLPLNSSIIIALVLTLGHALIGFLDDYIKVFKKDKEGRASPGI